MNTTPTVTAYRHPSLRTGRALLVVDIQNDFVEGGALGVTGGRDVASRVSSYLATRALDYDVIVATRDWHDPDSTNGGHFHGPGEDPNYAGTWPVHCVAHETGSDYAVELSLRHVTHHIKKGMGEPAYSGFQGRTDTGETLLDILRSHDVTAVDIVGIATDYCVKATALDAAEAGLNATVLADLTAAVDPNNLAAVSTTLREAGVTVTGAVVA